MQANKPPQPPPEFQEGAIAQMDAAGLIAIVKNPGASEFQKAKACQRLGELGAKEAVGALAGLLGDERLSTYARYGLEPIADASVDEALRAALGKLKGNLLIGVINSIGKRRDAKAGAALVKLLNGGDAEVAVAAAGALGEIATPAAIEALKAALGKTQGLVKVAVADGLLAAAEQLAASKREEALALYAAVANAPGVPKPARLGAMQGIIREEISLTRPR
jgi:HEAT repeat protein